MTSLLNLGAGGEASFYNGVATQSLRLDGDASLTITHSSAPTLNTKGTLSTWIKLHDNNDRGYLIQTGGTSNNNTMDIRFGGSQTNQGMHIGQYGRTPYSNSTNIRQRDFTSWYHLLVSFSSTSSDADERKMKIYINGTQITDGTFGAISQNDHFPLTIQNQAIYIGRHTPPYNYFISANLADFHLIDGQALTPDSFTEVKSGVCIPIAYTGSYGNNGFRLEFKETGTSQNASGIGADTSGNGNHWAIYSSTLSAHDSNMADSPENNFCVLNPLSAGDAADLSEGNLQYADNRTGGTGQALGTFALDSGKWYWEVRYEYDNGSNMLGITAPDLITGNHLSTDPITNYGKYFGWDERGYYYNESGSTSGKTSYVTNDIISFALDVDAGKLFIRKNNNSWEDSGDPVNGNNPSYTFTAGTLMTPMVNNYKSSRHVFNFGQEASFGGHITAGTETPSEGAGVFKYAPPTGYLAINSANLDDTTLSPNKDEQASDYMDIFLYTGDYSTNRDIALCNFTPDFSWNKGRSLATNHVLINTSVRNGSNYPNLHSNTTTAEANEAHPAIITNGIQVSQGSDNNNNETFVNWAWKCGGSAPTKTYKVVVVSDSGNKYRFRNSADDATFAQSAVTLDLQEGGTYTFDLSDSTMSGHPLRFSTTSDGTHGGGSEYTTGVTTSGTAGSSGATVTITVASSAPTLYYYCSNHSGMGGQINTNTAFGQTNFDGSLANISQSNQTSGFSIVTWTGDGNASVTLGHGLTQAPELIIYKGRENNYSWPVWYKTFGTTEGIFLDVTNAKGSYGRVKSVPTSTVIGNVELNYTNELNKKSIAYCFHSVKGYSKISSYEMNYNSNGTYVFCGFRPRWLMTRPIDQAGSWSIYDSERDPFNDGDANMSQADNTITEASFANSAVDFTSNGFKLRQSSDGYSNIASNTAIFMAFAEIPAKFANAR